MVLTSSVEELGTGAGGFTEVVVDEVVVDEVELVVVEVEVLEEVVGVDGGTLEVVELDAGVLEEVVVELGVEVGPPGSVTCELPGDV